MDRDEAFARTPPLTTKRLLLRQLRARDAKDLFGHKSDLEVTRAYGQEPHRSVDDTLAWIQRIQASRRRQESLFWCITRRGDDGVIGSVTLWNFDHPSHRAEIGYELHRSHWRQGMAGEAVAAVLEYAFHGLGLHRIEACPLAANEASRGLLLKLGFTPEGNLRQRVLFRGNFEDQLYFGLLKDGWSRSAPGSPP